MELEKKEIDLQKVYVETMAKSLKIDITSINYFIIRNVLKKYDVRVLLQRISESDFLQGKNNSTKLMLKHFTNKYYLNILVGGGYKNIGTGSKENMKAGQEAFQSIITKKLWRKKFIFKDEIVAQVVHAGGGINKLIMLPTFELDKWVKFDFPNIYKLCSTTPLKSYMKIYNESVSGEILEV